MTIRLNNKLGFSLLIINWEQIIEDIFHRRYISIVIKANHVSNLAFSIWTYLRSLPFGNLRTLSASSSLGKNLIYNHQTLYPVNTRFLLRNFLLVCFVCIDFLGLSHHLFLWSVYVRTPGIQNISYFFTTNSNHLTIRIIM